MRKSLITTIILCLFMIAVTNVKAADFSTSISGASINANSQFTVTLNVGGATNLMGLKAKLNYDASKLTLISGAGANGFTSTIGSNVVVDNTTGKSGNFSFATLTFKATSSFIAGQSTVISMSGVEGTNGTSDLVGLGSSSTIYVLVPKSSNNNLSSITMNSSRISGFSSTKTSYSLTVENSVTSTALSAVASDSKTTITGTGTKSLSVYGNTFYIVAKAENGATKTYTVNILRKDAAGRVAPLSTDNNLKAITTEGYNINFSANIQNYELTVDNSVNKLNVTAEASNGNAGLVINNIDELKVGANVITIVVTAENGSAKTYTIKVTRSNEGPTTTLDKLAEIIPKTTSNVINIDIKDNNEELTKQLLQQVKEKSKNLIINKYDDGGKVLYSWSINGKNITGKEGINTKIEFVSSNKEDISKLTNYADGMYLKFAHNGILPRGTKITLYVGDKYANGSNLKLYYYNDKANSLEEISDKLTVKDGYVDFYLEHCSDYLLSQTVLNSSSFIGLLPWIISIIEGVVIVAALVRFYLVKKGIKKPTISDLLEVKQ